MRYSGKTPDEVELKILKMVSKGYTYPEIANAIYKSVSAIKMRLQYLREYYKCKTTPHLIAYCTENGII